jgi:hypothetical protein
VATAPNLPSYAMGQGSFPEMYERWLVGPLFRPWAEVILEEVNLSPAKVCSILLAAPESLRGSQGRESVHRVPLWASTSVRIC